MKKSTLFDIISPVMIGPSSSHTFGPMVAANMFIVTLNKKKLPTFSIFLSRQTHKTSVRVSDKALK